MNNNYYRLKSIVEEAIEMLNKNFRSIDNGTPPVYDEADIWILLQHGLSKIEWGDKIDKKVEDILNE